MHESEKYTTALAHKSKEEVIADWERIHMIIEKTYNHLDTLTKQTDSRTINEEIELYNDILRNI